MNTNSDTNFAHVCNISEENFSHDDLIKMLKFGDIAEKQLAALTLDNINNESEGYILINNLTGCDGKIREAVALRINKLLSTNIENSFYLNYPLIFADASIDINANICRLVIDSVKFMKNLPDFSNDYLSKIISFIDESFIKLDSFEFRDKKYVINKQLFKLYWCLESLKLFADDIDKNTLERILNRASLEKEYTIREKVAQILVLLNDNHFKDLTDKLKADDNYYVKAAFMV